MAAISQRGRRVAGGHGRKSRIAAINVTPFVDVMLVLLIVFMVTAPLLTVGIPVELPRTVAKQMAPDTEPLTITIKKNGEIYIGEQTKVEKGDLLARLNAIAQEAHDRRIFIRADETAQYGDVAEVMAIISAAGYHNLGLVTDPLNAPRRPHTPDAAKQAPTPAPAAAPDAPRN